MSQESAAKVYVVVGATGDAGRAVMDHLAADGHEVRSVARGAGVSIDAADSLRRVFAGAHGAYLMIPFDQQAAALHAREDEIGARLAEAVRMSGVRRVVLLSGLNAPLRLGSSLGAARMEERLDALAVPELVHLRAGFFMENLTKGLAFVEQAATGWFRTPFRGDRPMPMVAAADVGRFAAMLLTTTPFLAPRVVELPGEEHTMVTVTATLGAAIGAPAMRYDVLPEDAARASMLGAGMSPSFVDAVLATARSFNDGDRWGGARPLPNAVTTTLAEWARETLGSTRRGRS